MANLARFLIGTSPSSDGGYDVNPGDAPVLRLEASSSLVYRVTFEVHSAAAGAPRATIDAPTLVLSNGATTGQSVDAVTPASAITVSSGIPAVRAPHLWEVRCLVNGGTNPNGSVNPDYVFSRFIAMRSAFGFRKIIPAERGEYDPVDAWAGAINEIVAAGAFAATIPVNGTPSTSIATGTDFPISTANGIATLDPFGRIQVPEWRKKSVVNISLSTNAAALVDNLDADDLYIAGFIPPLNHTYAALFTARITIKRDSSTDCAWVDISAPVLITCGSYGVVQFTIDTTLATVSAIGATSLLTASASVSATSAMAWSFDLKAIRPLGIACTVVKYDCAIIEFQEVA